MIDTFAPYADEDTLSMADARSPVLVVDDQAEIREGFVQLLRHAGFDSVGAGNGQEAMALLGGGLSPAVIVLDLRMPIMDGWEFLEQARPTAPVVVVCGLREEAPLPACVVQLLIKPVGLQELTSAVRMARDIGPSA